MERRRAIVYRASGRPSRVEVYMQAGGLPLEESSRFGSNGLASLRRRRMHFPRSQSYQRVGASAAATASLMDKGAETRTSLSAGAIP
jgi:hypothetical protein